MNFILPASNKPRSLLTAILGFCLFVLLLFWQDIPSRIESGKKAQSAIQKLDAMRRPMLAIKTLENQYMRTLDSRRALSELNHFNEQAQNIIESYLEIAQYNPELFILVKSFVSSYTEWINKQRWMFQHLGHTDSISPHEIKHYADADQWLLDALSVLSSGEVPLHRDIHDGQQAENTAQVAAIALVVYLFLIIILFQRQSARQLAAREQDLEITLLSIGDAVISTDIHGRVTRMNNVASKLTGYSFTQAKGRQLSDIFVIEHASTGKPVSNPVAEVLEKGQVVGLANHTVLISQDGSRYQIADSAAPIKTEK